MIELDTILVPVDYSQRSYEAVDAAVRFARKFGAAITLLHVVKTASSPKVLRMQAGGEVDTTHTKRLTRYCDKRLSEMLVDIDTTGVKKMDTVIIPGTPYIEIVRFAVEHDFDHIIMGSHGLKGIQHFLYGSVAEKVLQSAPCPVLVVKGPGFRHRVAGKTRVIKKADLDLD